MRVLVLLLWMFLPIAGFSQVTVEVARVPEKTPVNAVLYLAGSMNNWHPKNEAHQFKKAANGKYYLTLPNLPTAAEFKITRGSWETGEVLEDGANRPNRKLNAAVSVDTIRLEVESWQDFHQVPAKKHTATAQVIVMDSAFYMPQLKRSRRVWLYLPPSYATSNKKYPVLYMHDGQNLFDAYYSFSGEWGIDETLDSLYKATGHEVIVVGIDNGGSERMNEYTPWKNEKYGGGLGEAYIDFLAQTLKPYIDANYRTKKGRKDTAIAGSSMGGLISLYAILKHPNVFGNAGVLSPAFWVSPELYSFAEQAALGKKARIFLMAGAMEGPQMVSDITRMHALLLKKEVKPTQISYELHADGTHTEAYWKREFPAVVNWLFGWKKQ
ncbi:alpha/beta hydrolase [Rufibacter sp. LB8]|uniref:alpha/beta hydrolase n=1 Tax=Rufibacter sp. LB8 TaxID=2777781 RepID=UPI00178C529E|nr:alpha/beta hydrolase-fold protein [Rufibacter sp. LB8]